MKFHLFGLGGCLGSLIIQAELEFRKLRIIMLSGLQPCRKSLNSARTACQCQGGETVDGKIIPMQDKGLCLCA
jgi:hypothetical protein